MNILIDHTIKSIENAEKGISKIDDRILKLEGASDGNIRHFLNNVASLENCNYLEIGCWKGSTSISAMFNNKPNKYWCVDAYNGTWDGTEIAKKTFIEKFTEIIGHSPNLIQRDSMTITNPVKECGIENVNVYLYDGDHSDEATVMALSVFMESLQNEFIYIVDDWEWWNVKGATLNAIKNLGLTTLFESTRPWWNGFYISVLKKP